MNPVYRVQIFEIESPSPNESYRSEPALKSIYYQDFETLDISSVVLAANNGVNKKRAESIVPPISFNDPH